MSADRSVVYVIDDDRAVRDSLKWLLEGAGWPVQIFPDAQSFRQTVLAGEQHPAGCLVLDVRLPGVGGLELQEHVRRAAPDLPVLIVTGHGDVPIAVQAMKAGALDFIEKPFSESELLHRVEHAMQVAATRREHLATRQQIHQRMQTLSPREREVMELIVQGKLNKQVAADLQLSPKTVEVHRANVMGKMGATSLADLVRMAVTLESEEYAPDQTDA